ncbi:bleomycin hydrolase-like [Dendronephthya gigantea]|uniref:bleomycin hydrolase-like n=1 Tax=Dendronephthya gigantea TaxID=151771 RepID=UPI00106D2F78|nr:bleomycin hydrolase-like [Dendronephthya gigantea]
MASNNKGVSFETLAKFKSDFTSDKKNLLAQNVCARYDTFEVCLGRSAARGIHHVYNCKVNPEVKPVTNQKSSGRCWIFALLNAVRQQFVRRKNIESFEFSQTFLFFWDKIERANYLLNAYEEVARTDGADSRTMMFLMTDPSCDGGQWHMLVNLVTKYGLVPKSAWPDVHSATSSRRMNSIINTKMRSFAKRIVDLVKDEVSEDEMKKAKEEMLSEIYGLVSVCLGTPPDTFQWEYYENSKKYCKIDKITPLEFYEKHVKPVYDMESKVCLVNDPRPNNVYNKLYSVKYLGNMTGQQTVYLNQPVEVLKYLTVASVKSNEVVWFGCDVGKHFDRKQGLLSLDIHEFELTFNLTLPALNKADRLLFGESLMTHAMAISAVKVEELEKKEPRRKTKSTEDSKSTGDSKSTDDSTKESKVEQKEASEPKEIDKKVSLVPVTTTKWRVENSWGDDKGDKGYLMMTDEWFSEFVYEVVVDKKFVPEEILDVLKQEPIVLPPWDPMGALACRECGN